jgi:hypothetical protein
MVHEFNNNSVTYTPPQNKRLVNINNNKYYDSYTDYMNERHVDNTYKNNKRSIEEGCYNANSCSTINNELNFVNNSPTKRFNSPPPPLQVNRRFHA